ncbi:hypothetical protein DEDE109153_10375 [Deinococcus deserti]
MLSPGNPLFASLNAYARSVCHALELPHGHTFHAEVFVAPDRELSLCEIACRTGGGRINETLRSSGGPDLNQLQFLIQTGAQNAAQVRDLLQASEPEALCGWMLIAPQPGLCVAVPDFGDLEGVRAAELRVTAGEEGWERAYSGDSMGHLIIAGDTEEALRARMGGAVGRLQHQLRFEHQEALDAAFA